MTLKEDFANTLEPIVLREMGAIKDRSRDLYSITVMEPVVFTHLEEMLKNGFECPDDYLYWVLSGQKAALGLEDDAARTREESAAIADQIAKNWHPAVNCILTQQLPAKTSLLNINSVPEDFRKVGWNPGARVTLIGDAVHVVGPTSGSRAIVALRDAATLCRMLVGGALADVAGVIKRYESEMQDHAT